MYIPFPKESVNSVVRGLDTEYMDLVIEYTVYGSRVSFQGLPLD